MKKYDLKTAVYVTDAHSEQETVSFFEEHFPNCNLFEEHRHFHLYAATQGGYWFINDMKCLDYTRNKSELKGYTILEGIPKNWREEMKTQENTSEGNLGFDIIIDDKFVAYRFNFNISEDNSINDIISRLSEYYGIEKPIGQIVKPNKSESRVKELEEEIDRLKGLLIEIRDAAQPYNYSECESWIMTARKTADEGLKPNNF